MKKLIIYFLTAIMLLGTSMTVSAEHYYGAEGWEVSFDGKEMISNFKDAQMTDTIREIQPGDDVLFQVNLKSQYSGATDWYMTNEVISTLEESVNVAEGGAYSYLLKYYDVNGKETVLYDSEVVGGEATDTDTEAGLHQATEGLEDYFYLGRLAKDETAVIRLYVQLDGETQGNAYQDTLAKLQMNFAVEKGGTNVVVQTGDHSPMMTLCIVALSSAIVLLILAVLTVKLNRQKKGVQQ